MGVAERKLREKAYRETSILEAAKKVFMAKGLLAATIDDIAAEAELGKGTLYRHYRSKEEIMLTISEQATVALHLRYVAAAAEGGTGLERILRMMGLYYTFVVENPAYFSFIAFFESPLPTASAGVVHESTLAINALFQDVLRQGMADGSLRSDLKPALIAGTLWATSYGMMQFIVSKGPQLVELHQIDLAELFNTYLAELEDGLRKPA